MAGIFGRRAGQGGGATGAALAAAAAVQRQAPQPAPEGQEAAAQQVQWEQAAARFAAVRPGDHERRYQLTAEFGALAAEEEGWLRDWQRARPQDVDAACVDARGLVDLAWLIRGSGWAKDVTREQWQNFHRILGQVAGVCAEATRQDPADPVPWIVQLPAAMGLSKDHDEFRALWAEVAARAPYHVKAHQAALSYWLPRWSGSRELATAFVEDAIAAAPPGSLLTLLRLELLNNELRPSEERELPGFWHGEQVRAAVDAALADLAAADPYHARVPDMRNWLALFLTRAGRLDEAAEQFRLIGPFAGGEPWRYTADPAALFLSVRTEAVRTESVRTEAPRTTA
ncbi:hypothetical protein ABIA32_002409 [Streptacidiphilus sp. MAP12-20]|uniref:DUF4034 domain-containing protein n=1 Tax=Streptacidiphilus sp. MAP12-20 TaxID=3156299 RepID=UPI003512A35B